MAALLALVTFADIRAAGPYALVAGRWEPTVIVVDIARAIAPGNDGTANAVVARMRVTPDVESADTVEPTAPAAGLPSNVIVAPDGRFVWVVNHAGNATAAQVAVSAHGHAGTLAELDLRAAVDPVNDGSTYAMRALVGSVGVGPVGIALLPNAPIAVVSSSEGPGREDGGRTLAFVDLTNATTVSTLLLALGDGGAVAQTPGRACEAMAEDSSLVPRTLPNGDVGCFANVNGVVIVERDRPYVFTANGGTDDVSVVDVARALAGVIDAEVARIPVGVGPWGITASPARELVAVTNRESAETGVEGNTISFLDVARAIAADARAEVARVVVGTDDAAEPTRPFGLAFAPDGRTVVVANFRSDNVSIVSVDRALDGGDDAEIARIALTTPTGTPARPRGVAVTADGRHAVISGGLRDAERGGWLWVIDLGTQAVVGTVSDVGNEPYLVAVADVAD